jgi:hypothetical protein
MDTIIKKKYKNKLLHRKFFIDSRTRDNNKYKYSYNFQLKLYESFKNVKALELRNINIDLNNRFLIHDYNKYFQIEYVIKGNVLNKTLSLLTGNYEFDIFYKDTSNDIYDPNKYLGKKLVETINNQINNDLINYGFNPISSIEYEIDDITNFFTLKKIQNIKIKFLNLNGDSLAHILGFKPDIFYSNINGTGNIISDYPVKFKKEPYGMLYINNYNNIYSNKNSIINSFYIINNNSFNNIQCVLDKNIKYFNPYEEYIDKLNIELKDYYGNYIDLNNNNFSFELIFYYYG